MPIHILKNLDFGRFSLADPFKDKHRFATLLLQPSNITFVFFEFLFQYLNFFFKLFILWLQFKYFRCCYSYPNLNFSISGLTASYLTWNSIHQISFRMLWNGDYYCVLISKWFHDLLWPQLETTSKSIPIFSYL